MKPISYMAIPGRPNVETAVCEAFGVCPADIGHKRRNRKTTEARQAAMYLLKLTTALGPSAIAQRYNRDHATAIHAAKVVPVYAEVDKAFSAKLAKAKQLLNIV